jgi:hypothetical protein
MKCSLCHEKLVGEPRTVIDKESYCVPCGMFWDSVTGLPGTNLEKYFKAIAKILRDIREEWEAVLPPELPEVVTAGVNAVLSELARYVISPWWASSVQEFEPEHREVLGMEPLGLEVPAN